MEGKDLEEVQDLCRDKCTLVPSISRCDTNNEIVDEFYSGYLYTHGCDGTTVSSAEFIEGNIFLNKRFNTSRCR